MKGIYINRPHIQGAAGTPTPSVGLRPSLRALFRQFGLGHDYPDAHLALG